MTSNELRKKFLDYFKKKKHKIVPSFSLIPADPTVLFTTAGMQQFSPYLAGEKDVLKDFGIRHLTSCQKCFRANDIEEIGDDTHHTFFEMLGNWSIGEDKKTGYFKEGAIKYALEFVLKELRLKKENIWITIFRGNKDIPKDEESKKIWLKLGIPEERIREFGEADNLWGPVKDMGPCGPTSEIHYDRGMALGCKDENCGPNCLKCKRIIEIWNLVFMEYSKEKDGSFKPLPHRNVDTGAGFERMAALLQGKDSAYETDLFWPIILELEKESLNKYEEQKIKFRILADHIRASVFLAGEGIIPSNTERGYVLRRILRRAIRIGKLLNLPDDFLVKSARKIIEIYKEIYPEIQSRQAEILIVLQNEEERFIKTLENGLKEFKSQTSGLKTKLISGKIVFDLYQSYGFPLELTKELAKEANFEIDENGFKQEFEKHQAISRAGVEKKFGGLGKEATFEATKFHTATHLLHQALRQILGEHVQQMGSDITAQRLRFDFSHPKKMTPEEIKRVEDLVNQKIKEDLEVKREEMSYQEAINSGALAFFKEKYPDRVSVYSAGIFSKEICAGPHVKRTSEIEIFKIIKEESAGAGIRRIRAGNS
ncbi:MAG: alanine--tRNA ligase [Candidatus Nealsonbacteria bacterium]|nr:alanine--tRNA ligase [Candidatus Nealsonbacteria bacterium]